jgi:hypothetical protein
MDKSSPRIQVQSFLQGGLGFIVSARRVQHVSQAEMRGLDGGKYHPSKIEYFSAVIGTYRGGLCLARLRRVAELVHAKIEDELSLDEMSESVSLSTAHFAHAFRKSTGESPHQFVLRHKVERAKEMLRATVLWFPAERQVAP